MRGDNLWRFHCIKFCYYSLTGTFMLSLIQRNSNHTKSKTGQFLHLSIDIFFSVLQIKVTGGPGIYIYIYIYIYIFSLVLQIKVALTTYLNQLNLGVW